MVLCGSQNSLKLACMSDQFLSELKLWCLTREEAIAATGNADTPYFKLTMPLQYRSTLLGGIIEIPTTFLTDLGSIPRAVWWWLSPDDYDIPIQAPCTITLQAKGRSQRAAAPTKTGEPRNSRSRPARSNGSSWCIELPARRRLQCRPSLRPALVTPS